MNENKKSKFPTIVIIILIIALAVAFVKISILENDINRLQNVMNSQHQTLMNQVESIYGNVDDMLKKQVSLLSGTEYAYGKLNTQDHTFDVNLKVVPKRISDDMVIEISSPAGTVELNRTAEGFEGSVQVPLFMEDGMLLMTIQSGDGIQTEYLEDVPVCHVWTRYIPSLYHCDISGSAQFGEGKYTLNGLLDINLSPVEETPDVQFEKFVLVTTLNGEEIGREDITHDVLNYQSYPHGVYFRDDYVREYAAKEGDELIIRLQATDSMGYIHECILHNWKEQNGASVEALYVGEVIYDSEGTVLYGKGYQ